MLAKDLVSEDIASINSNKDILDALFTLFSKRRRILPVLDESKFVGTLTISSYAKLLQEFDSIEPESIKVADIMDENPKTLSPNTDAKYVINRLCDKGVYGVPLLSGHEFTGMVLREDTLKHFPSQIAGKFKVIDVMSHYVSTNSIHDPVEEVAKKIISGYDRRIIILDDKRVEGTVTIQDLANILLAEKADLTTMSVKNILVPNPVTVSKNDDVAKAVAIMLDWGVYGLPVVDKKLEGIIKDKDIVQRIRHQL